MKKGILLIVISTSLITGLLVGVFSTTYFLTKFYVDAAYISEVVDTTLSLDALSQIHNQDINGAVKTLETGLDGNVVLFENVSEISESTKTKVNRSLSEIREYNLKYRSGIVLPASNKSLQQTADASAEWSVMCAKGEASV